MKIVVIGCLIYFSLIILLSCEKPPLETKRSSNREISVSLLFEHEGIKVYRFVDEGKNHYFTSKGEAIGIHQKLIGKTIIHYDENIQ